jgi:HAE1 family hydrophobic/amphiphilic exporter-1
VRHTEHHGRFFRAIERFLKGLDEQYGRLISWALLHRVKVTLIAFGLLILSVFAASLVPGEFFPTQDEERFQVKVETPPGSSLGHTRAVCSVVEQVVGALPGVELISTTIGGGAQEKVNEGYLWVKLTEAGERPFSQNELMVKVRQKLAKFPSAVITVQRAEELGGSANRAEPIQYVIRGTDLPAMEAAALRVADRLKQEKGFVDVDTTVRAGKDELNIRVDREKAAQLGVKPAQVALAVRNLVSSVKVGEMAQGEDRYDIRLWLPKEHRDATVDLDWIKVRNFMGQLVSLADLVTLSPAKGPTQIEREDRQRQVIVYANLEDLPLREAQKIVEGIGAKDVPAQFTTTFTGEVEHMQESFGHMVNALVLAIILVYIILASQFESFIHPFTIMLSLPFSVIGAFGALLVSGYTLSMISMIGVIMLMGLVTKNAILLVDRANQNLAHGLSRFDALVDAGRVRLRPILMTTFAMIFGMLPVALALSKGSEVRAPMAAAVIGGLVTSTLLTLIVVPVVYTYLDDVQNRIRRVLRREAKPTV